MKKLLTVLALCTSVTASAQVWKTLPKGVRILGYRNVTTSKIGSNFNQFGSQSALGPQFRIDASTINGMTGNAITPGNDVNPDAYNQLVVGEYKVDAEAQLNVHGLGFGYGITDKVMLYVQGTYYDARVKAKIKRTKGNNYSETGETLLNGNGGITDETLANNIDNLPDITTGVIQSAIQNHYGYKPIGEWHGKGYGDMETGLMYKAIDKGIWGLMVYPGVVLPTGRQDDPNNLQDIGFGDGQLDVFTEVATGYVFNDHINFGTVMRYTYQNPTNKELRVPNDADLTISSQTGKFDVKYGDRFDFMLNSTLRVNNWVSFTPVYRYMYQMPSKFKSEFATANEIYMTNSDKQEHVVQLTTSLSSIQPFLNKEFLLPAQINVNVLKTVAGKNVPAASRFEVELRMLF